MKNLNYLMYSSNFEVPPAVLRVTLTKDQVDLLAQVGVIEIGVTLLLPRLATLRVLGAAGMLGELGMEPGDFF